MGLTWLIIIGATLSSVAIAIPVLRMAGVLGPRRRVLANGIPAQATLVGLSQTNTTINEVNIVCRLKLRVEVPGRPAYDVETKEPVPMYYMAMMMPGSVVGVRVDPEKPELVFMDWDRPIQNSLTSPQPTAPMTPAVPSASDLATALHDPSVIAGTKKGLAADLLRTGQSARGLLKSFADTGQTVRATGRTSPVEILDDPLFVLTVELHFSTGMAPIEGTVVHRVPRALVPSLRMGMALRCAVDPGNPTRNFAVDWDTVPAAATY